MKPKWQEDSSCVFAYYFCRGTCQRRDTAEKKKTRRNQFGADQEKGAL